jgi:DNA modification methylase
MSHLAIDEATEEAMETEKGKTKKGKKPVLKKLANFKIKSDGANVVGSDVVGADVVGAVEMNKIYCGNCQEVMAKFPDGCVDLVVTSPPYDNIRDYKGYVFGEEIFKEIVQQLYRVVAVGGIVVWIVGDAVIKGGESGTSFRQALGFIDGGFKLHDTMIYEKNTSSFPARRTGKRYTQIFEYMFVFCKGKIKTGNMICDKPNKWAGHTNWGKNTHRGKDGELVASGNIKPVPDFSPRNNIWKYNVGKGFNSKDKESHKHPAIFPEKLAEDHILSWSNAGDVVLDCFVGSGTTCKMAKKNGRQYIGIDASEEYCALARKIIAKY